MIAPFWGLPGPKDFLEQVVRECLGSPGSLVPVRLPDPRPAGVMDALCATIRDLDARACPVDGALAAATPAPQLLAEQVLAGLVRGVDDLRERAFDNVVYVVDVPRDAWGAWWMFLRRWRETAATAVGGARLIILAPTGLPAAAVVPSLGQAIEWKGRVGRQDTRQLIDDQLQPSGLLERTAAAVAVELVGWDAPYAEVLKELEPEELADPRGRITPDSRPATWEGGGVDLWDGRAFEATPVLAALGVIREIEARIWRGQVCELLPFVDTVRLETIKRHRAYIQARIAAEGGWKKHRGADVVLVYNEHDLEIANVLSILRGQITQAEQRLLFLCADLRRSLAHLEVVGAAMIIEAADLWRRMHAAPPGWEWPRCGQTLTLLIGPVAAGKSTYAHRRFKPDSIVSSDEIRASLEKNRDRPPSSRDVFGEVVRRMCLILAAGVDAVVDATNLYAEDRAFVLRHIPADIPVRYVVIDRPLEEKLACREHRRPDLVVEYHQRFQSERETILTGDGRALVEEV